MRVWSLASGSSGNAYVVQAGRTTVLLECGLPAERTVELITMVGLHPTDFSAILVTHDHSDHARSAKRLSRRWGVPVIASRGTIEHPSLKGARTPAIARPNEELSLGDLTILAFPVPHDADEPVGFRVTDGYSRLCLATDLGSVSDQTVRHLANNDLLILEANYDDQRLRYGPYPAFLKDRVAGAHGHLSNDATAEALARCGDGLAPTVWLAHLSQVNNTPELALATVQAALPPALRRRTSIEPAGRHRPSLRWSAGTRETQLTLL
ncbi:MAG: MBL fold metallo-hydrolase [Chloroflexota bacterium]